MSFREASVVAGRLTYAVSPVAIFVLTLQPRCLVRSLGRDFHLGVVVVKDFPLRRLADQFFENGPNPFRQFFDNLPLRRRRSGIPRFFSSPASR